MRTVFHGTLEECIDYIHEEDNDLAEEELSNLDIEEDETSGGKYFFVKELSPWDMYQGSF